MADSMTVVKALHEVDPGFRALCETVFGKALSADDVHEALYTRDGIAKMMPTPSDVHVNGAMNARLVPTKRKKPIRKDERVQVEQIEDEFDDLDEIEKEDAVGIVWSGEFSKTDSDKRQVFGWASVVQLNGEPVVDRQGDLITPEEMEKAAYSYVHKSRVGGSQHRREGETPFHASNMIESLVLTPEKIEKMGFPEDTPVGWWVGYQVHDESTWQDIKEGRQTGFSIHGRGKRVPVDA